MQAPQVIMIGLISADLAIAIVKHGESKGSYHFPATLIASGIVATILYYGGFWG